MEINLHHYDKAVAEEAALLLHFLTTGQDAELNPKRVLLPPASVDKYWKAIADGNEDVFNLQLTLLSDSPLCFFADTEAQEQYLTTDVLCPVLKSLIFYARAGKLGALEGSVAAFVKEDIAGNLGSVLQQILAHSEMVSTMPEVAKNAKSLAKLLETLPAATFRTPESTTPPAPAGGCCVIA